MSKKCEFCGGDLPQPRMPKDEEVESLRGHARWTLIGRVPRNHWFFREAGTGRVAIADASGSFPEITDDGVWYLDPNKTFKLRYTKDHQVMLEMPLIAGKPSTSRRGASSACTDPGIETLRVLMKEEFQCTIEVAPEILRLVSAFGLKDDLEEGTRPVFKLAGGLLIRVS